MEEQYENLNDQITIDIYFSFLWWGQSQFTTVDEYHVELTIEDELNAFGNSSDALPENINVIDLIEEDDWERFDDISEDMEMIDSAENTTDSSSESDKDEDKNSYSESEIKMLAEDSENQSTSPTLTENQIKSSPPEIPVLTESDFEDDVSETEPEGPNIVENDLIAHEKSSNMTSDNGEQVSNTESKPDLGEKNETDLANNEEEIEEELAITLSKESQRCARHFGVAKNRIKFVHNDTLDGKISSQSVVVVKVSGNQSILNLQLGSTGTGSLHGICIFATGNQSHINLEIEATIRGMVYYGLGNQSSGTIELKKDGMIDELLVRLSGNRNHLSLHSHGDLECNNVTVQGKSSGFSCK